MTGQLVCRRSTWPAYCGFHGGPPRGISQPLRVAGPAPHDARFPTAPFGPVDFWISPRRSSAWLHQMSQGRLRSQRSQSLRGRGPTSRRIQPRLPSGDPWPFGSFMIWLESSSSKFDGLWAYEVCPRVADPVLCGWPMLVP